MDRMGSMTDHVRVTIDLGTVARNLRTADGGCAGEGTARHFLQHAGFTPAPDGTWVAPRAKLRQLNYGEVIAVRRFTDA